MCLRIALATFQISVWDVLLRKVPVTEHEYNHMLSNLYRIFGKEKFQAMLAEKEKAS